MENQTITVTQLTNIISKTLQESIGYISVKGEISNYKQHSSGHRYFTLKDADAQISCTLWKGKPLSFIPSDGMLVTVFGKITVYPPRGSYQIDCDSIRPFGQGSLYLAFEALKKKLDEQGYFEQSRKRRLPAIPINIGIATSETGAAIKDMFSTISRRFPNCKIYFRPTTVQGDNASKDIVDAILELNQTECDVIIIGRGGGSLEDLWVFNEEMVANAIFNSNIPIISAVGHETDFTISDFVADFRAATPTAAAELVTPYTKDFLLETLDNYQFSLSNSIKNQIDDYKIQINNLINSRAFTRTNEKISIYNQQIDDLNNRMDLSVKQYLRNKNEKINSLELHCHSLEPFSPLRRGFALILKENQLLSVNSKLSKNENLTIIRQNEISNVNVENNEPINNIEEYLNNIIKKKNEKEIF